MIFGYGQPVTGQHRTCGAVGVQRVGFALATPAARSDRLTSHLDYVVLQRLCETSTVAAGALHAGDEHLAEALRPPQRDVIAGRIGAKLGIAEELTGIGDRGDVDGVEMGVDADDHGAGMSRWWCPLRCNEPAVGDNSGRAGRQDIDEAADRLLIKSCPPYRALVVLARTAPVRQINWKTTQQGVSRTTSHHQRRTGKTILTQTRLTRSMSDALPIIEYMFDGDASPQTTKAFADVDDAGVVNAIAAAARKQSAMCAQELAAIGELYARRAPEDDVDRLNWAIDGHENVVAEVAAALGISRGRARGRLRYAIALRERLPRVAELFARGLIDFRIMAAVVSRTELVEDAVLIAELDAAVARHAPKWMRLSEPKLFERIDMWVMRFDPAGRRVPGSRSEDRYVEIDPTGSGLAGIWAQLHATDGAALDQKLDALAGTVCSADPRTKKQRRADALGAALAAGLAAMRCECGSPDCSAAQRRHATDVVIHVLAEQATISGDSQLPGYLPAIGPLTSTPLRDLATTAKVKPLVKPSTNPEPGYRPSAALAEFVRLRDLTCRFPGCDEPAEVCDIDHTVPFPLGPTHPSNLKLLCRFHHLLKTFYTGFGGWADRQLQDGTVEWTAPSGHTYATTPGGSDFFPARARQRASWRSRGGLNR